MTGLGQEAKSLSPSGLLQMYLSVPQAESEKAKKKGHVATF